MNAVTPIETPLGQIKRMVELLERHESKIRDALVYGGNTETFDSVCVRTLSGKIVMHELPNSVLLCEPSKHEGVPSYHVYIAAGDLQEILDFQRDALPAIAKSKGCGFLSFSGRLGWQKVLKNEGWYALRVTMIRDL